MEDDVAFVWTFVVIFGEIELVVGGVDVGFDGEIVFADVFVFWDLWAEGKLWSFAPFVAGEDGLWSEVDDDGVEFVEIAGYFLSACCGYFFENGWG